MRNKRLVDRLNDRRKDDSPPMFWIAMVLIAVLIMSDLLG